MPLLFSVSQGFYSLCSLRPLIKLETRIFIADKLLLKCTIVKPPDGDTEEMGSDHVKTPTTLDGAEAQ